MRLPLPEKRAGAHRGGGRPPIAASLLALLAGGAAPVFAGSLELAVHAGATVPFYEQSFRYDPGPLAPPIPGLTVEQSGSFGLDARGALALGASVTLFLNDVVGLEARLDTADVRVDVLAPTYQVRADLPAPLPDLTTQVDLGTGRVDVERLRPVSLNLKLRTPGRVRLAASGGVSYLPRLQATATQTLGLGVTGFDSRRSTLDVATLALQARAAPSSGNGRFGANAGLGVQVSLSHRASLFVDARGFLFGRHTLEWGRADARPLSAVEEALLRELETRLEAIDFDPTFFQAVAGVALSF